MISRKATLYLVGLGLSAGNITVEALDLIKKVDSIFLETYTSKAPGDLINRIMEIRSDTRSVTRRDLEDREGEALINELSKGHDVALLVIGDPMIATTHAALAVTVKRRGFNVRVVNSVSIICALLNQLGLSPYKLGLMATITYPRMGVLSMRAYDVLLDNLRRGLHTILLLDIRDDGGFMDVKDAANILIRMENNRGLGVINEKLLVIYAARIGWEDQEIVGSTIKAVPNLGDPPHTIVIPGILNPVEIDYLVHVIGINNDLVLNHMKFVEEFTRRT
ncbi:MAG: diphthine synthase [Vulcanisaeta sp. AZ3]